MRVTPIYLLIPWWVRTWTVKSLKWDVNRGIKHVKLITSWVAGLCFTSSTLLQTRFPSNFPIDKVTCCFVFDKFISIDFGSTVDVLHGLWRLCKHLIFGGIVPLGTCCRLRSFLPYDISRRRLKTAQVVAQSYNIGNRCPLICFFFCLLPFAV